MSKDFIHPLVDEVVPTICADLATPRALTVAILLRYGEWDQLALLATDPLHYLNPEDYWADAGISSLLRKWEELPTSFDRKAAAEENFWKAERQCYRTNERLSPFLHKSLEDPADEAIFRVVREIRKEVERILGPLPTDRTYHVSDEECVIPVLDYRFGPGATYGDKGRLTTIADKMSSNPTLTSDALGWLFDWSETKWATSVVNVGSKIEFVRGNRFTTVPKDCVKDRGIAVEPSINVFYQLAYGKLMKARLNAVGLNLLQAQEKHKRVACEASSRGHFATIDLSNASDTVAYNLVKLLLPPRWFALLSGLRSPMTRVNGKWVKLEKFSSMGNGFTFELETVLFAAISMVVTRRHVPKARFGGDVLVFGDDIIVPTESARDVIAVLRYLGFETNASKTFVDGPFRESCGGDYFRGVDVRPYFQKESLSEPQHLIALANGLRRVSNTPARWHSYRRAWFRVLDALPSSIRRCRGPQALGDICIHDEIDKWSTRVEDCIRYIRVYQPDPDTHKWVSWKHWKADTVLAAALYGGGDGRRGILPRNAVASYREDWVPFS